MGALSTYKLGAIALVVGPLLSFVMFLIQPGGILIDAGEYSNPATLLGAWIGNAGLTKVTAALIAVGLMIMAFGIYEVHVAHRGSRGDGLNMAGLAFLSLGVVTWVFVQALTLPLANATTPEAAQTTIYIIRTTLLTLGGIGSSAGLLLFTLGVAVDSQGTLLNRLSWIAALASLVSLVGWIIAALGGDSLDSGITIGRSMYIFWVIWLILVGRSLWREEVGSAS